MYLVYGFCCLTVSTIYIMNFSHSPSFPPSLNFLFLPHGEVNITYQRLVAWTRCLKILLMFCGH